MKFPNYLEEFREGEELTNDSPICMWADKNIINSIIQDIKLETRGKFLELLANSLKIKSINCRDMYHWTSGEAPIPIYKYILLLNLWRTICNKTKKDVEEINNYIFNNLEYFSVKRGIKARLPTFACSDLAYLIGYIIGDGHLLDFEKEKLRSGDYEFRIELTDYSQKFLVEIIKPLFKKLFDIDAKTYVYKNRHACELYFGSKVVYMFIHRICGIPNGVKKGRLRAPEFIKNLDSFSKASFIAGFFGAEGWISPNYKKIGLGQADGKILADIISLLNDLGIESRKLSKFKGKDHWEFSIRKDSINEFIKKIPIKNHNKINKMNELKAIMDEMD